MLIHVAHDTIIYLCSSVKLNAKYEHMMNKVVAFCLSVSMAALYKMQETQKKKKKNMRRRKLNTSQL